MLPGGFSALLELEVMGAAALGCCDLSGVAACQGWGSTTLCIPQGGTDAWKRWLQEAETINN